MRNESQARKGSHDYVNDFWKKKVLSLFLNDEKELQFRISKGSSFHTVGAAIEKAREAMTVLQYGMFKSRSPVDRRVLTDCG